jgi:aminopeptidase S
LGGDDDEINYIEQSVSVPTGSPYLGFWYWLASGEVCGGYYDQAVVSVNGTEVVGYELCGGNNTNAWVERTVSLAAYAGQTVMLRFLVDTDIDINSNFFLDDVAWQSSAASLAVEALPPMPGASLSR